jgi:hypothetical protein
MSFPFIINFNDYLHGYDGIKNKKYDAEVERMQKYRSDQIQKNIKQEQTKHSKLEALQQKAEAKAEDLADKEKKAVPEQVVDAKADIEMKDESQ